jgi:hypothetical protein
MGPLDWPVSSVGRQDATAKLHFSAFYRVWSGESEVGWQFRGGRGSLAVFREVGWQCSRGLGANLVWLAARSLVRPLGRNREVGWQR